MTLIADVGAAMPGEVGIEPGAVVDDRYQLIAPLRRSARPDAWRAYDLRLRREVQLEMIRQNDRVTESVDELQAFVENYAARVLDAGRQQSFGCCYIYVVIAATVPSATPHCIERANPISIGEWA